ncbi:cupin domain-containing protein [Candidatus Altiarchaeota archaeon]
MSDIRLEKPSKKLLTELGVDSWGTWEKSESEFPWTYSDSETCYILEGKAEVEASDGRKTVFGPGDLVTFPKGLECFWRIREKIRKKYAFGLDR